MAFVVPGLNEGDNRHREEDRRHESPGISTHGITARVVDTEEEHRVLREQLHRVLREEWAPAGVAVTHTPDGSLEQGTVASDDANWDVEHGSMTVGQAPVININSTIQQAPSINMDNSGSGGFWHGTRGMLLILALILVIVAVAIAVPLVLVLGEEAPAPNPLNSTANETTPPSTPPLQTEPPTQPSTQMPTQEVTQPGTQMPTQEVTQPSTQMPTQ